MPPVASFPNCAVDGAICSPIEACEEDDGDCSAWCNCGDDGVWSCDEACVTSPCPDAPSPGGVCDGPAMLTCTYSPTTAFPNGASCVCGDSDGPLPRHWGCAI